MSGKYYVVWSGHHTGVFDTWEECKDHITGYPNARYKAFPTQEAAIAAYRGDPAEHLGVIKSIAKHTTQHVNYDAIPEINTNSIAVDAACSGNPGLMEYRGVDVQSGAQLFHVGPLPGGTNNIGEFLAIVHGLAWLKQRGLDSMPIYSDSMTGRAWVRNKTAKTTLTPSAQNAKVFELLERAIQWLKSNTYTNPILTWNTDQWGEIPADFGRK